MANIEVLESGVGTVGHSTAKLVGPVPHNLCEVSHDPSVDRSHTVAPVLHLVIPGLGNDTPAPLGAGHVQVLPTATCADLSVALMAVLHGAGVGPPLGVGCSLAVPVHLQHV